jgi:hypothetical protein
MLRGTSLMAIAILWGVALLLLGKVLLRGGYPAWLGWTGAGLGAVTIVGAAVLLLDASRFAGVIVYGLMASIVVQL